MPYPQLGALALHAFSPTAANIGDDGAKALAEALKVNGTLTQLTVFGLFPLPHSKGVLRSGLGRGLEKTPVGGWVGVCLAWVRKGFLGPGDVGFVFPPASSHGPLPSPLYERVWGL